MTQQVRTVKIKGKDYIDVAERVRLCNADQGFSMLREEYQEIAGTHIIRVYLDVKGRQYIGDAEIKVNAKPGTADGDSPISCAQTSAIGRALGFAGYGSLESIASADEVQRNLDQHIAVSDVAPMTEQQVASLRKLYALLGQPEPSSLLSWPFEYAKARIGELSKAYREQREKQPA